MSIAAPAKLRGSSNGCHPLPRAVDLVGGHGQVGGQVGGQVEGPMDSSSGVPAKRLAKLVAKYLVVQ